MGMLKTVLGPVTLTTTASSNRYTVPAGFRATVRHVHVCNGNTAAQTFTASIGADASGTRIFDAYPIDGNDVLDYNGPHVLTAGQFIEFKNGSGSILVLTLEVELEVA